MAGFVQRIVKIIRANSARRFFSASAVFILTAGSVAYAASLKLNGYNWTLLAWNNLGMHCMDADYSIFSLLPPYNTIQAQLIDPQGRLVQSGSGITVTYEAVADASGSINRTSEGKTNFWDHVASLFGASLPVDTGLTGKKMPGSVPQSMDFSSTYNWFIGEGIPITPIDDAGRTNPYPMLRVVARDSGGNLLAAVDTVVPVSVEMDCRACHGSNTVAAARPPSGWANAADAERDYRLNILLLHDAREGGTGAFTGALASKGFNPAGLYQTVVADHKAILCAACHSSEALGGGGVAGVRALTRAMHSRHASVINPSNGLPLDATENRTACYQCHPGSTTRCLRGAMGSAVASDGSMTMQCQSCHGNMTQVGAGTRTGWLDEPSCEQCHTGTAVNNNGAIRYDSVFEASGAVRRAVNSTFAVNAGTLFRFSTGHGGLQCSACHGSTHAEYPATGPNDNVQSAALQGHKGVIADCTTCHASMPQTLRGGPHGMHPVGQSWVRSHGDAAEHGGASACRDCHGTDFRGTVLSRTLGERTLSAMGGTKRLWRGYTVGCYTCHNGPGSESATRNRAPVAQNGNASTGAGPVAVELRASDPDGNPVTVRIVSQAAHGTVGLFGKVATYFPEDGYTGSDSFTFAATDGYLESNLATVIVNAGTGGNGNLPRPDGEVRVTRNWYGNEVFNADGSSQTVIVSARKKQKVTVFLRVTNDGVSAGSLMLTGTPGTPLFRVKYFSAQRGGSEITPSIVSGTYALALRPRTSKVFRMEITPTGAARKRTQGSFALSATSSADPSTQDTVRAIVKMR